MCQNTSDVTQGGVANWKQLALEYKTATSVTSCYLCIFLQISHVWCASSWTPGCDDPFEHASRVSVEERQSNLLTIVVTQFVHAENRA